MERLMSAKDKAAIVACSLGLGLLVGGALLLLSWLIVQ